MNDQMQNQRPDDRIRVAVDLVLAIMLAVAAVWVNLSTGSTHNPTCVESEMTRLPAGNPGLRPRHMAAAEDAAAGAVIPKGGGYLAAQITFRTIAGAALGGERITAKKE